MWKCPKCGREFSREGQDHYCVKPQTIDAYIAAQDEAVQAKLIEIREILRAALPDAEERISWSMPTYWKGRNIIHFAASKKHLGLYPGGRRGNNGVCRRIAGLGCVQGHDPPAVEE